ncbi:uncharacterized protein LOC100201557 isoform X2 [Hydra vulgaris]|nr:uncharacterized protein LOC100201557 isoform X2 [Hydra vulgaris]
MLISLQAKIDIIMEQEFVSYSKEKEKLMGINKKLKEELDCCKYCIFKLMPFVKVLKDTCFVENAEKPCHIDPKELETIDKYFKMLTGSNDLSTNTLEELTSDHLMKTSNSSHSSLQDEYHILKTENNNHYEYETKNECVSKNQIEDTELYVVMDARPFVDDQNRNDECQNLTQNVYQEFPSLVISEDYQSPEKNSSLRIESTNNSINTSIDNNNNSITGFIDNELSSNNELFLEHNSEWNIINTDDVIQSNNISDSSAVSEISASLDFQLSKLLAVDENKNNDLFYNENCKKSLGIIKAPLRMNLLRKNRAGYGRPNLKEKKVIIEIPKVNKRPLTSEELSNYENGKLAIRLVDLAEAFDAYKLDQDSGINSSKRLIEYVTIPDLFDEKKAPCSSETLGNSEFNDNSQIENMEITSGSKTTFLQKLLLRKKYADKKKPKMT